jgi:2-polyprenyl-3-methyl-5-hydroxy-6-metoxy-1,4-benzoquinol methylase
MSDYWNQSAEAWIADQGERGDFSRAFVLDKVMLERIDGRGFAAALDVGCGEGRFCRVLRDRGIAVTGIDPTMALLRRARELDPAGDYREGRAEALVFADSSFDLVISYLTLIDIPDTAAQSPRWCVC